jgi:hypothetical protein
MRNTAMLKKSPAFRRIRGGFRQGLRKVANLEYGLHHLLLDTNNTISPTAPPLTKSCNNYI